MMALGSQAPDFALPSTDGETVNLADFKGAEALVVMFICNHCPYVIHIAPALAELAKSYEAKGVKFVAINSNDTDTYPADSFELMKKEKANRGYTFPYLFDESQSVAKAYSAACTPDLYVFGSEQQLVYRGQFDDTRPERISSGNYNSSKTPSDGGALAQVLDTILNGEQVSEKQYPSMGCNIKWRAGNAPSYFG